MTDPVAAALIGAVTGSTVTAIALLLSKWMEHKQSLLHRWDESRKELYADFLVAADRAEAARRDSQRLRDWEEGLASQIEDLIISGELAEENRDFGWR